MTRRSAILSIVGLAARPWQAVPKLAALAPAVPNPAATEMIFWMPEARWSICIDEEMEELLKRLSIDHSDHPDWIPKGVR